MKRKLLIAVFACLVVTVPVVSGVVSTVPAAERKPALKIGAVFSVTGRASSLGLPEKNTALMVAEQINQAEGINGYPVEVILKDDESLPTAAENLVNGLIEQDKVLAIIGPSTSDLSMTIRPITEAAKVPVVSCASAEAIVTPAQSYPYTFKVTQNDSHGAIRIIERLAGMNKRNIGILYEKSVFGRQGCDQLKKYAPDLGVTIVAEESFTSKETRMTEYLKRAGDAGSQAIVVWAVAPVQTIIPKNARDMGITIPLFLSHAFGNPKYIENAGDAAEGIVFPAGRILVADSLRKDHPQKEILTRYKEDYEKKFGPVTTFGGHACDALRLVAKAVKDKNVGPDLDLITARQLIRDGLEQTKGWIGIAGEFTMSPEDHTGLHKDTSLEMCTIRGGKVVPLDTAVAGR
ncbi:MAG: ABC transporter substrate-binding protein [Thermodesulfobacteriota bacterium]